jgi:hypothetical protein
MLLIKLVRLRARTSGANTNVSDAPRSKPIVGVKQKRFAQPLTLMLLVNDYADDFPVHARM